MSLVHPTAIVEDGARLGADVTVGAFSIVGRDVTLEDGVSLDAHVLVRGETTIGARTRVATMSVIGGEAQVLLERVGQRLVPVDEEPVRGMIQRRRLGAQRGEELHVGGMLLAVPHARAEHLDVREPAEGAVVDLLRVPLVQHGREQAVFAAEQRDDLRCRRTDLLGDPAQRTAAVAVLAEDRDRLLDDAPALLDAGAVRAARGGCHSILRRSPLSKK